MSSEWVRVTKENPCKICGRSDWDTISADGKIACCMRVESDRPMKNGGWAHKLDDPRPVAEYRKPKRAKKIVDISALHAQWEGKNVGELGELLGVSIRSLMRLRVGWDGICWVTPMFDGMGHLIGARRRYENGKQKSVPGTRSGLFVATDITQDDLFIVEGPSDLAALLDLGFDGIGRPSCSGGTEFICEYLRIFKRNVIIVSDNDAPKVRPNGHLYYPGQEGSDRLCDAILPLTRSVTIIKPPKAKDIRAWYLAGCTREQVLRLIKNTTTIFPERGTK